MSDNPDLGQAERAKWPKPETKLEIGLRKLRDYGGGAVLSDAEANAVLDDYDALAARLAQAERENERLRMIAWTYSVNLPPKIRHAFRAALAAPDPDEAASIVDDPARQHEAGIPPHLRDWHT